MSEETFWVLVEKQQHEGFYNFKFSELELNEFWSWYTQIKKKRSPMEAISRNERVG